MKLRQSTPFLFGLAAFALVVCATGCLGSVTLYDVGRAPVDAVIADVNDDGRADIVVANAGSNDLTVRLQGPLKNGRRNAPFDADAFIAPVLLGSGSYSATMTLIATTNGKRSLSTTKTGASQKK